MLRLRLCCDLTGNHLCRFPPTYKFFRKISRQRNDSSFSCLPYFFGKSIIDLEIQSCHSLFCTLVFLPFFLFHLLALPGIALVISTFSFCLLLLVLGRLSLCFCCLLLLSFFLPLLLPSLCFLSQPRRGSSARRSICKVDILGTVFTSWQAFDQGFNILIEKCIIGLQHVRGTNNFLPWAKISHFCLLLPDSNRHPNGLLRCRTFHITKRVRKERTQHLDTFVRKLSRSLFAFYPCILYFAFEALNLFSQVFFFFGVDNFGHGFMMIR